MLVRKLIKKLLTNMIEMLGLFIVPILVLLSFKKRDQYVWGPVPIINNKYWSEAMRGIGLNSKTLMHGYYDINNKKDFDIYFDAIYPWQNKLKTVSALLKNQVALYYILSSAKVIHIPFSGLIYGDNIIWQAEAYLYKLFKIKVVVIPYGADAHMYSKIANTSAKNALLISYPLAARDEQNTSDRVFYWSKHADCVITGALIYGMPRWDIVTPSPLCIDTMKIKVKEKYSNADGKNGIVRIIHSPNHRGFKGTEYLINAVERLKLEGFQIELKLLEKTSNDEVLYSMQEADILVEQLIAGGYALNAIEGMASGLPVLSNIEDSNRSILFSRYSFLNECPIYSSTPESVFESLKRLVTNPLMRKDLGIIGRMYVEKYHSYAACRYLFGSIYKHFDGYQIDLINLYHPLLSNVAKENPLPKNNWK